MMGLEADDRQASMDGAAFAIRNMHVVEGGVGEKYAAQWFAKIATSV